MYQNSSDKTYQSGEKLKLETKKLNFIIMGNFTVGKTSLINRYIDDIFHNQTKTTLGIDQYSKFLTKNYEDYKVTIFDTAGQERYGTITKSYFRNAHAILFVYEISDRDSFIKVGNWMSNAESNIDLKNFPKILVGNKCDLANDRQVPFEEAEKFSKTFNMQFFETSAKMNINVDKIFDELMNAAIEKFYNTSDDYSNYIVITNEGRCRDLSKSGCC
jgi:small GTP-binding protein